MLSGGIGLSSGSSVSPSPSCSAMRTLAAFARSSRSSRIRNRRLGSASAPQSSCVPVNTRRPWRFSRSSNSDGMEVRDMPHTLPRNTAMSDWTIDWPLYAPELTSWRSTIETDIEATRQTIAGLVPPSCLTVEVRLEPVRVIPELGMVEYCAGPLGFSISVPPLNPFFVLALTQVALRRQVAHEANNCLRNAGP